MDAMFVAQNSQGGSGKIPVFVTPVIRAFLYCRSFNSISATPHCAGSILVARSRPDTVLSHLLLFSLPAT